MNNDANLFAKVLHALGFKLGTLDVVDCKFFRFIDVKSLYEMIPVINDGWTLCYRHFENEKQFIDKLGSIVEFDSLMWKDIVVKNPFYGCKTQEEICILLDLIDA